MNPDAREPNDWPVSGVVNLGEGSQVHDARLSNLRIRPSSPAAALFSSTHFRWCDLRLVQPTALYSCYLENCLLPDGVFWEQRYSGADPGAVSGVLSGTNYVSNKAGLE